MDPDAVSGRAWSGDSRLSLHRSDGERRRGGWIRMRSAAGHGRATAACRFTGVTENGDGEDGSGCGQRPGTVGDSRVSHHRSDGERRQGGWIRMRSAAGHGRATAACRFTGVTEKRRRGRVGLSRRTSSITTLVDVPGGLTLPGQTPSCGTAPAIHGGRGGGPDRDQRGPLWKCPTADYPSHDGEGSRTKSFGACRWPAPTHPAPGSTLPASVLRYSCEATGGCRPTVPGRTPHPDPPSLSPFSVTPVMRHAAVAGACPDAPRTRIHPPCLRSPLLL